jgi:hypothetical protein
MTRLALDQLSFQTPETGNIWLMLCECEAAVLSVAAFEILWFKNFIFEEIDSVLYFGK